MATASMAQARSTSCTSPPTPSSLRARMLRGRSAGGSRSVCAMATSSSTRRSRSTTTTPFSHTPMPLAPIPPSLPLSPHLCSSSLRPLCSHLCSSSLRPLCSFAHIALSPSRRSPHAGQECRVLPLQEPLRGPVCATAPPHRHSHRELSKGAPLAPRLPPPRPLQVSATAIRNLCHLCHLSPPLASSRLFSPPLASSRLLCPSIA